VSYLTSEKPHVARYLTNAPDEDARIARAVLRDSAILYKRDTLRSALIDADCGRPLRTTAAFLKLDGCPQTFA
jgi:hypothetical protein